MYNNYAKVKVGVFGKIGLISLVGMLLLFCFFVSLLFIAPNDNPKGSYEYSTAEEIYNSLGYSETIMALEWLMNYDVVHDIEEISYMYNSNESNIHINRPLINVYYRISYSNDNGIQQKYIHVCKNYDDKRKNVVEITQEEYNQRTIDWLFYDDKEHSEWAREKNYNEYAIEVILKSIRVE